MNFKKNIIEYANKLLKEKLVLGSWGNLSIKKKDKIFITPAGIEYKKLTVQDISVVDIHSDKLIEGLSFSSEYKMHKKIYKANQKLKAIIHTHSENLMACSILKEDIPPLTEEQIISVGTGIKSIDYYPSGSEALANEVSKYFNSFRGVMLANHGFVGAGEDLNQVFLNCKVAEKTAGIYLKLKPFLDEQMILDKKNIENLIRRGEK